MNVVVTGATGFLGVPIVAGLRARGDAVTVLTRDPERARARVGDARASRVSGPIAGGAPPRVVAADLEMPGPWREALAGADAIVHLAGESIAGKRWDARQKQILRDSRVEATRTLVEALADLDRKPRVLVSASGADYYPFATGPGDFDDDEVTETDPPAETFLGRLCRDWEAEAAGAEKLGVRVVRMRTGVVIGGGGGALAKMTTPFKLFVGGKIGSGRQWFSWIHRDDAVAAYLAATADDRYTGPINLVAGSIRNSELAKALGHALHRPSWLPVPGFALKAATGELAEYLLNGRNVVPKRLRELGFAWKHVTIEDALRASERSVEGGREDRHDAI